MPLSLEFFERRANSLFAAWDAVPDPYGLPFNELQKLLQKINEASTISSMLHTFKEQCQKCPKNVPVVIPTKVPFTPITKQSLMDNLTKEQLLGLFLEMCRYYHENEGASVDLVLADDVTPEKAQAYYDKYTLTIVDNTYSVIRPKE